MVNHTVRCGRVKNIRQHTGKLKSPVSAWRSLEWPMLFCYPEVEGEHWRKKGVNSSPTTSTVKEKTGAPPEETEASLYFSLSYHSGENHAHKYVEPI